MTRILSSLNTSRERPFLALFAKGEARVVRRAKIVGRRAGRQIRKKGIPAARRLGSGVGRGALSTLRWARDNPVKALVIGGAGVRVARSGIASLRYAQAQRQYERNMPASKRIVETKAVRIA